MKKAALLVFLILLSASCSWFQSEEYVYEYAPGIPDYERLVKNVTIVGKNSDGIVYRYRNVRVDDLAIMAALYCAEQSNKRAFLGKITLDHDNARQAMFLCKNQ